MNAATPGRIQTAADFTGGPVHEAEADVIVVGSGCAGATVARVLAEQGLDVLVVEEGKSLPMEARRSDTWTAFREVWRDAGMQVARGRTMFPFLQGMAVGGSTVINGAIVHRLPEPIFAQWVRDFGVGTTLRFEHLQTLYDRLDAELSVAPGPAAILGQNNLRMQQGVEKQGIRGNVILRNVVGCEGTTRCLQGCPRGRKQSMDLSFLPRAMADGARIYSEARVEQVIQRGGRASGVRGTFVGGSPRRPMGRFVFRARRAVVLAASAIQTPVLLRRSGVLGAGLVGSRLQAHPGASIMGVFPDPIRMWEGITQGYETTHWWSEKMKFETVGMPPEVALARLPGLGPRLMDRIGSLDRCAQWGVQVRSSALGTVRPGLFGNTSIRWDWTDEDICILKVGLQRVALLMFDAGAERIYPGIHGLPEELDSPDGMKALDDLPNDPRLFHGIVSHMFGTALMGPHADRAVVDDRGAVHGMPGLWVADSAIFPTNMGVNPAHTVCALAWHIAEQLLEAQT
jgi:choline dehydrogenase-like flavoprotein